MWQISLRLSHNRLLMDEFSGLNFQYLPNVLAPVPLSSATPVVAGGAAASLG